MKFAKEGFLFTVESINVEFGEDPVHIKILNMDTKEIYEETNIDCLNDRLFDPDKFTIDRSNEDDELILIVGKEKWDKIYVSRVRPNADVFQLLSEINERLTNIEKYFESKDT